MSNPRPFTPLERFMFQGIPPSAIEWTGQNYRIKSTETKAPEFKMRKLNETT